MGGVGGARKVEYGWGGGCKKGHRNRTNDVMMEIVFLKK